MHQGSDDRGALCVGIVEQSVQVGKHSVSDMKYISDVFSKFFPIERRILRLFKTKHFPTKIDSISY